MKEAKGTLIMLAATILVLIIVGFFINPQASPITLPNLPTTTKKSAEADKKVIKIGDTEIEVTLANTGPKRSKGLSGVKSLGESEGMLFVFEKENQTSPFWMKGMVIAIDIVWISDGKVGDITPGVQPPQPGTKDQDLALYAPDDPYDYVLEVNAGFAEKSGIQIGDNVDLSRAL